MSTYTLELVGFHPYGQEYDMEAARAKAIASLERLIPYLNLKPSSGVHSLGLQAHPETALPWPGQDWRYGMVYGAFWHATVRAT